MSNTIGKMIHNNNNSNKTIWHAIPALSSPLEIEGFNSKGKYYCKKYAETRHHYCSNA